MRTESFKVLQTFGLESYSYKMLVQAKSGNRYIVWYPDNLGVDVGQEVLIAGLRHDLAITKVSTYISSCQTNDFS
ncbi:hypothetical protein [Microseira wollei]|uniref:Uncharacterized protein n=1 Tax=Microseira wollei NIES-4236 TaxID=2530354 RepID=A0AAV3XAQ2_9CYAN|nr:hypothetical protein [Microseira wollei]GET37691.1 hypothetical protein MiSe_24450 [Microseira wollei NIES-4236]